MLKRQKLYRDTNNTIYHVLTDGSIRTYPDFKIITTVDESTLFPEARKVDVLDTLYCDPVHDRGLMCVEQTGLYKEGCCLGYDIFNHQWVDVDVNWLLEFKVENLVPSHKYIVDNIEMIFDHFDTVNKEFRFISKYENYICVKSKNIYLVEDVEKIEERFEVGCFYGDYYGINYKTKRSFNVPERLYLELKAKCNCPQQHDIVYVNNSNGIHITAMDFVKKAAKKLHDDTVMLRYAYGMAPELKTEDHNKKLWKVLYVDADMSLIAEHCNNENAMICVCDNDSLCVSENQEDDEPF